MDNDAGILCSKDRRLLSTRTAAQQRTSGCPAKPSIEPGGEPSLSVRAKERGTPPERSRFVASIRQRVVPIAALALGGLVIALVHRLSRDLDYQLIIGALKHVPVQAVGLSVAATGLSFIALIGREFYAVRYMGARVPAPILLSSCWWESMLSPPPARSGCSSQPSGSRQGSWRTWLNDEPTT